MKLDEIRALDAQALQTRVTELQEEQFRLRFRAATETLEQPLRLREVRRDIARVLTVLREREIAAASTSAPASTRKRGKTRAARKVVAKGDKQAATKRAAMKRVAKRGIRSTSAR